MDDTTQESVTTETPSLDSAPASTDAAAPLGSEEASQTATAGGVTAQSVIDEAPVVEQEGATPPPSEDDPLKDVPSVDELKAQVEQKVPYAAALLNLRTALEARNEELGGVKGKFEPVQPLLDQYGDVETIQSRLAAYDSLFTPVVNPDTQQPETDANGFPKLSAAPFIEQVDKDNPGLAEQMLSDLLRYSPETPDGQKVPLVARVFEAYGLDPKRLNDYRNIDALAAPSIGEVTSEELETIPDNLREAYKTLPSSLRQEWKNIPEDEKKFHLEGAQERIEARKYREAETQRQKEAEQQQFAEARTRISQEQDSYVSSQLQAAHASIMDDVARQVTFSADANENARMLGVTGAFIFALRDPEFAPQAEAALNAFGAKLDPNFHEELSVADKHMRDYKALELMGQKGMAQQSLIKANAAKTKVMAKIAPLAVKVAKALGAQASQRASQRNGLLDQATTTRPSPGQQGTQAEQNGYGIPGMLPNDPRYGIELAKRTGLLG